MRRGGGLIARAAVIAPAALVTAALVSAGAPASAAPAAPGSGVPAATSSGQTYYQDFTAGVPADLRGYDGGQPGGSNCGTWDSSQIGASGGQLVLSQSGAGSSARSAGLALGPSQLYGTWEVRFKVDPSPAMKYAFLLWPDSEKWPNDGELDFAEDDGGSRGHTRASTIWGTDPSNPKATSTTLNADFTGWHTAGVEWTADAVRYTLDGQVWATHTTGVPTKSMHLALQVQPTCVAGGPGSASAYVDSVAVYGPGGSPQVSAATAAAPGAQPAQGAQPAPSSAADPSAQIAPSAPATSSSATPPSAPAAPSAQSAPSAPDASVASNARTVSRYFGGHAGWSTSRAHPRGGSATAPFGSSTAPSGASVPSGAAAPSGSTGQTTTGQAPAPAPAPTAAPSQAPAPATGSAPATTGHAQVQNDAGPLTAAAQKMADAVASSGCQVQSMGGTRASAVDPNGHPSGKAVDFMVGLNNMTAGDCVANFLIANWGPLGLDYIIWQQRMLSSPTGSWQPMADRGSDTANHKDHVHGQTKS